MTRVECQRFTPCQKSSFIERQRGKTAMWIGHENRAGIDDGSPLVYVVNWSVLTGHYLKHLKMLWLYLDTYIIGLKLCSMFSILNEIALLKEWQYFMTNNGFWTPKLSTQTQQNKNKNMKFLVRPKIDPSTSFNSLPWPPIQLKQINCRNSIHRNINKQSQRGLHFFNTVVFSVIF